MTIALPAAACAPIVTRMFIVTETDAAVIRELFEKEGKLTAAIELRRQFPRIAGNEKARECVRTIAGRTPQPVPASDVTRLKPRGRRGQQA